MQYHQLKGIRPLFIIFMLFPALGLAAGTLESGETEFKDAMEAYRLHKEEEAFKLYKKAADAGYAEAYYFVGRLLNMGEGCKENKDEAITYFKKALDAGDIAGGNYGMAGVYRTGEGVERNKQTSDEYYAKAFPEMLKKAEAGNFFWQRTVGLCYRYGYSVDKDEKKAFEYYMMAANQGYVDALDKVGVAYDDGIGVDPDFDKALDYLTRAAEAGDIYSYVNLGDLYSFTDSAHEDQAKAFDYYMKGVDGGEEHAYWHIGRMYLYGVGRDIDYKQAMEWFKKAADLGSSFGFNSLGYMYDAGLGVEEDDDVAFDYYKKAAKLDNYRARFSVANYYDIGKGSVRRNWRTAFRMFQDLAEYNYGPAERTVGEYYLFGVGGIEQDVAAAKEWFTKAYEEEEDEWAGNYLQVLAALDTTPHFLSVTNASGDSMWVDLWDVDLKPYMFSKYGGDWFYNAHYKLNKAERIRIIPLTYDESEKRGLDYWFYYTHFSDNSNQFDTTGTVKVWVTNRGRPTREIGFLYLIGETDTEDLIIKIPAAVCWPPN